MTTTTPKPAKKAQGSGDELPPIVDFERLRRSAAARYLRWQGRFDTDVADRYVPWVAMLAMFGLLFSLAMARFQALDAGHEMGDYLQATWLIRNGEVPQLTISETHMLAIQLSWIMYPVAHLTRLGPPATMLLAIQSLALSAGVVPLWLVGRRIAKLRAGGAVTLVMAYALFPAVHNLNLADFHPESIALPCLLAAFYYGLSGRWIAFGIVAAVAVACRADLALAVAGIGIVVALHRDRKAGTITAVVGLAYAIVAVFVLQPYYAGGAHPHIESLAVFGDTPSSALGGLITQPFRAIQELFREGNFQALVVLLAPVAFLPVVAPRYLLPVVPLQALYLIADVGESQTAQQFVPATAFVMVAAAMVLARTGRSGVTRVLVDPRVLGAVLLAACVFFVRDSAASPYRDPLAWERDALDASREGAVELTGEDSVMASDTLLAQLGERDEVYRIRERETETGRALLLPVPAPQWILIDSTQVSSESAQQWEDTLRAGLRVDGEEQLVSYTAIGDSSIQVYRRLRDTTEQ